MLVCLQVCSDGRLSVRHVVIVSGTSWPPKSVFPSANKKCCICMHAQINGSVMVQKFSLTRSTNEENVQPSLPLLCFTFQKMCAKSGTSGNDPFLMSDRALITPIAFPG